MDDRAEATLRVRLLSQAAHTCERRNVGDEHRFGGSLRPTNGIGQRAQRVDRQQGFSQCKTDALGGTCPYPQTGIAPRAATHGYGIQVVERVAGFLYDLFDQCGQ